MSTARHDDSLRSRLAASEDGSAAIEYMLLLIFAVMPLAMAVPLLFRMLLDYSYGISAVIAGPFP